MPTPNVVRSRSPVAISSSCLQDETQTRQSRLSRSTAEHDSLDLSELSNKPATSGRDEAARADVDITIAASASAPVSAIGFGSRADVMETDVDSPGSHHDSDSDTSRMSSQSPASSHANILSPATKTIATTSRIASASATQAPPSLAPAGWEIACQRVTPLVTSSFFRPFAKFTGTQKSDRKAYNVEVELKHVDVAESFCCGYLKIEGLTDNLPTITTYFEGEIIGTKYTFQTRHPTWGASEKTDMAHWSRFAAFAPLKPAAKAQRYCDPDFAGRDVLFMRWKEIFLVPDYKQRSLDGASFEGFYYIAFDQCTGTISGIYFHSRSEKFQQLELSYENAAWSAPAWEFM